MRYFLSCDWGTTTLRVRLAEIKHGKVLMEESSGHGIAGTFTLWQQSGHDEMQRIPFYLNVIRQHINRIEEKIGNSLQGVKVIISGMASSSIGLVNIPYAETPVPLDGSGIETAFIGAGAGFDHDVLVISGIKTGDDVMRGEETQLIGCVDPAAREAGNELYIFPGTHTKHITVAGNQIIGCKTYMTGEFFELLSKKSILKTAVAEPRSDDINADLPGFEKGVNDAVSGNLLHSVFRIRINQLFDKFTGEENFNYLSGLLIGTELKDLGTTGADVINLICGSNLALYYRTALRILHVEKVKDSFPPGWVDEAAVRGQYKIGRQLKILI